MSNCDLIECNNRINKSYSQSSTAYHPCVQNSIDGLPVKSPTVANLAPSSTFTPAPFSLDTRLLTWLICLFLAAPVLLLAGCGPERAATNEQTLLSETERIAVEYQAARNLAQARTQLDLLEVANINQWLIYTTEEAIVGGDRPEMVNALVILVMDLGLPSNSIRTYAQQQNLVAVATVDPTPPPVALAVAANVSAALPPAAPSPQPSPLAATPVITTVVVTATTAAVTEAPAVTASVQLSATTAVALAATATSLPTTVAAPMAKASSDINVRSGPGVEYPLAGSLRTGEEAQLLGKNAAGDWWEVALATGGSGWVYGQLVETAGDVGTVAVALNIPTPPPTPVPTATSAPAAAPIETPAAPADTPMPEATTAPAPPSGGPDFRIVGKHLWDVVENGGQLNGISVTCGEKRQLVAIVLDAAGNRLNGVAVQAIYGAQEVFVSGDQGKGDGIAEFVLGGGQALKVIRDADGRAVTSDEVYGMTTKPWEIPYETLIGGRFCTDDASCKSFVDQTGCYGHYSWTVTFQRSY